MYFLDAAAVYNQLGETGLAIEWLAKMVQAGYTAGQNSQPARVR